jgi:LytS/YehU family sensor histidine kinase
MTPIPIVAIGLLAGLVIAGSMLFGEPLHFITRDYYSLLLGIFFGVIGFAIFGTRARLMEARAELALAATQHEAQEKLLLETELKLLQAQIEPHFLFNTLSNVVGLIRKEPDVAEQTLLNLTTLLRAFLKRTREESSSLAEELEIIRAYLDIQSIRMRGRLSYTVAADDAVGHTQLPPLLVQPLVENAIKHGIDPAEDGGAVDVTAHLVGQDLLIEVADTGIGFDDSAGGNGTGLGNVRNRLRALYGDRASMTITEREPRGVAVTLTLPATEP